MNNGEYFFVEQSLALLDALAVICAFAECESPGLGGFTGGERALPSLTSHSASAQNMDTCHKPGLG